MAKKLKLIDMPYTCEGSQRWVKSMKSKGYTPRQIWLACRKPEWIAFVIETAWMRRSPWSEVEPEERCRLQDLSRNGFLDFAKDFQSSYGAKVCCDILRSKVTWTEVQAGLLKRGWR